MSTQAKNDRDLVQAAMALIKIGIPVLPVAGIAENGSCTCMKLNCASAGKHPLTKHGVKDASLDPETVYKWFTGKNDINIGIATGHVSRILVIDVDFRHSGEASLGELEQKYGPLKKLKALTGGGFHLFSRHPGGHIKNSVNLAPGIDIRADNGYVVAPPSIHRSGALYRWESGVLFTPDDLPELPEAWKQLLTRPPLTSKTSTSPSGSQICEGRRNHHLTSLAGSMHARGMSQIAISKALQVENTNSCNPPLADQEIEKIAVSIARYTKSSAFLSAPLTDMGNADRLLEFCDGDLLYHHAWKQYLIWRGTHWEGDTSGAIHRLARGMIRALKPLIETIEDEDLRKALRKHMRSMESEKSVRSMLSLAAHQVPVDLKALDANSFLLNVQNGTVDLKTGHLRPHHQKDLITRLIPISFNPEATCPFWHKFLNSIMDGNHELVSFLQRAVGYSLTGETSEQVLFILYGVGANGKSTFSDIIRVLLGDYAKQADFSSFILRQNETVRNDIARLVGARYVSAAEIGQGKQFDEALIKQITGCDPISARFLHKEHFEFIPNLKLWLSANHKPKIRGTDEGIWRRLITIPFRVTFSKDQQDKRLAEKLRTELPGILNWAIQGCLEWAQHGLKVPDQLRLAAQEYREEEDVLGGFLAERCIQNPNAKANTGSLFEEYLSWCQANNETTITQTAFGVCLRERGFKKARTGTQRYWEGIGLNSTRPEPTPSF